MLMKVFLSFTGLSNLMDPGFLVIMFVKVIFSENEMIQLAMFCYEVNIFLQLRLCGYAKIYFCYSHYILVLVYMIWSLLNCDAIHSFFELIIKDTLLNFGGYSVRVYTLEILSL